MIGPSAVGLGPELVGQTVVVIGGSAGIGLETARRAEGVDVVISGRDTGRLKRAGAEIGARVTAAFDDDDTMRLRDFFDELSGPIDHVMVTASAPTYGPLLEMGADRTPARSP